MFVLGRLLRKPLLEPNRSGVGRRGAALPLRRLGILRCANLAAENKARQEQEREAEQRWLYVYFASWFH
jgi:hypothetical protein